MKRVEVINSVPRQNSPPRGLGFFKWMMLVLAFVALFIVLSHKVVKIEIRMFDTNVEIEKQQAVQRKPDMKVGENSFEVTFRRYNLSYVHGKRVKGDRLIYLKRKRNFFQESRNYSFSIRYPKRSLLGAPTITAMRLFVLQTSKVGQAVIRGGGVGYRNVTMDVTSYNTTQCRYTIRIYGVNK